MIIKRKIEQNQKKLKIALDNGRYILYTKGMKRKGLIAKIASLGNERENQMSSMSLGLLWSVMVIVFAIMDTSEV